ncbi:transmembrane protein, putative (macronuclear) [Tetrahymena thermophila SB210]|uniref:Transmembrane protein, putative n=1 Tax=Tetrahymena thermophila (strain SB210) TaxID=312017 RepID=W7XJ82_TETTS|nr:transmembrane protein, putative [Tetrahymena thermophila SB210]EWS75291.1 transmembrane protein, putative [Tetrahymena thermophila SB210]|eukprot:XP_012652282.1 transmembrane protein, putative [Tetrahymena thermophila SB210]
MSELSSRLLCVAYGLSIVSVTYIYKYFAKSIVIKQKAKLEDGRTSVDEMTMEEELFYYKKKQHLKDLTKSLIAIAITFILTIITFVFYCKNSILDCLRKNGFSNMLIDEICNLLMTILLNSVLFAVVIYRNYVNTKKINKNLIFYQTCNQIQIQKEKGAIQYAFQYIQKHVFDKKGYYSSFCRRMGFQSSVFNYSWEIKSFQYLMVLSFSFLTVSFLACILFQKQIWLGWSTYQSSWLKCYDIHLWHLFQFYFYKNKFFLMQLLITQLLQLFRTSQIQLKNRNSFECGVCYLFLYFDELSSIYIRMRIQKNIFLEFTILLFLINLFQQNKNFKHIKKYLQRYIYQNKLFISKYIQKGLLFVSQLFMELFFIYYLYSSKIFLIQGYGF